jgi:ATP-dependent Lon protease
MSLACVSLDRVLMPRNNRDATDKVSQLSYYGNPSAALLKVLDLEQNIALNKS